MAHREDILERARKINPWGADLLEEIFAELHDKMGLTPDDFVGFTGDMTEEEKIMQTIEYFLKRGYAYEEAKRLGELEYFRFKEISQKGKSAIN